MDSFMVIRAEDASDDLLEMIESIKPIAYEYAPAVWERIWKRIKTAQMMEDRWQLFEMFCWNYEKYSEGLESHVNDRVMTMAHHVSVEQAFQRTRIDVNCFATNLISSGRTLVGSFESFMNGELDEGDSDRRRFEDWVKDLFDRGGVYALLTELRNEAQHGQPLVSLYPDGQGAFRAAFDLDQLMRPEHFSIKGRLRRIMEDMLSQMDELGARHHRISYTWCMERYFIEVMEVAATFYSCSSVYIREVDEHFHDCIEANPECCGNLKDGRKAVCVLDGDKPHLVTGTETPGYAIHAERQDEVESRLEKAKRRFNDVISQMPRTRE